jgi:hypothetical protein
MGPVEGKQARSSKEVSVTLRECVAGADPDGAERGCGPAIFG